MSFHGDIASIALGDVIQNLNANQKTGTLTIQSGKVECHILFRQGKIISYADNEDLSVQEWLVEKEIIPAKLRDEVEKRYGRAKRKTLGEILADLEILDAETYRDYLFERVQDRLYEVLSFRQGNFAFHMREFPGGKIHRELGALELEINPMSLLMEAARRTDDWQKIRKHIPNESEIYIPSDPNLDHLFEEVENEVAQQALVLMDGSRTLGQVISKLPWSRFDACRAIAALIAEKKVRPLEGEVVLQAANDGEDPGQAIPRLKAILEREPNNRDIVAKLADLSEKGGRRDEAATYHKLLAVSYLEEGDLKSAEERLRKSLSLNLRDHSAWHKLWDTVRQQGDDDRTLVFGKQFVANFKRIGLMEVAQERLLELVGLFPGRRDLRLELAEVRFQLGDRKRAVADLTELGNKLLRKDRLEEAEEVFARILKYDRDNARAQKLCEELSTGRLARKRARRREIIHKVVTIALLLTLCLRLGYELHVHGKFFQATKSVFAEGLLEQGKHEDAIRRVEEVRRSYPFSLTSLYKAPSLLKALEEGQARASHEAGQETPSPAPHAKPPEAAGPQKRPYDDLP